MTVRERVRRAAVAGQFYQGSPEALARQLEWCFRHPLGPGALPQVSPAPLEAVHGFVAPHAGYIFSGPIAARSYASLASLGRPQVVVILGPNHYAMGEPLALSPHQRWETPLGQVEIDEHLGEALAYHMPRLRASEAAHRLEHSIEVQLPFLQQVYGSRLRMVPISLADQELETSLALGAALAETLTGYGAAVIASSDFSHYLPDHVARERDQHALEAIQALDPARLGREVEERDITMCGPGPVMAMLECMRRLGAREARLLGYGTSGDASGDFTQVVAYAAIQVSPR